MDEVHEAFISKVLEIEAQVQLLVKLVMLLCRHRFMERHARSALGKQKRERRDNGRIRKTLEQRRIEKDMHVRKKLIYYKRVPAFFLSFPRDVDRQKSLLPLSVFFPYFFPILLTNLIFGYSSF